MLLVPNPIPVVLHCPRCGYQHVDAPDPSSGWDNPPHRSHLCARCGTIWRPCEHPTTGVASLETPLGSGDNWPDEAAQDTRIACHNCGSATYVRDSAWDEDGVLRCWRCRWQLARRASAS